VDPDTFLTTLAVMVDAGCQAPLPPEVPPGPRAALRRSEVVTLGRWGPWACGRGERAFSRDAHPHQRAAFPRLPHRRPGHRRRRRHHAAMGAGCRAWRLAAGAPAPGGAAGVARPPRAVPAGG